MSDWIKHDGKGMPVDGEKVVQVMFRDGWTDELHHSNANASYWHDERLDASSWVATDGDDYIVAYRVVEA